MEVFLRFVPIISCFLVSACLTGPSLDPARLSAEVAKSEPATRHPRLNVPLAPVLSGNPVSLSVTGIAPDRPIEIIMERVSRRDGRPVLYRSSAIYIAPASGDIDLALQAPQSGDYSGINPAGLFNTLKPTVDVAPDDQAWSQIDIFVDLDQNGETDLAERFTLLPYQEGLIETPLGAPFPGAFIIRPPGNDRLPLIVTLGGSEGNDRGARSSGREFASRGYAALGLPYYSPAWGGPQKIQGLPKGFANIDIDYLVKAVEAAALRPDLDTTRLGLYGVSKGAEYVLLAATKMPEVDAIAAIVPSDVVWEGWGAGRPVSSFAYQGTPFPYVPYKGMNEERAKVDGEIRKAHDAGRLAFPDRVAPARIAVETIDAPVFLVGGDKDTVWDSGGMARNIKTTRDRAGLSTELWVSEAAGHGLSGDGYGQRGSSANLELQRQAYPALLEFFARHVKSEHESEIEP